MNDCFLALENYEAKLSTFKHEKDILESGLFVSVVITKKRLLYRNIRHFEQVIEEQLLIAENVHISKKRNDRIG